jgi:hypothetical protein
MRSTAPRTTHAVAHRGRALARLPARLAQPPPAAPLCWPTRRCCGRKRCATRCMQHQTQHGAPRRGTQACAALQPSRRQRRREATAAARPGSKAARAETPPRPCWQGTPHAQVCTCAAAIARPVCAAAHSPGVLLARSADTAAQRSEVQMACLAESTDAAYETQQSHPRRRAQQAPSRLPGLRGPAGTPPSLLVACTQRTRVPAREHQHDKSTAPGAACLQGCGWCAQGAHQCCTRARAADARARCSMPSALTASRAAHARNVCGATTKIKAAAKKDRCSAAGANVQMPDSCTAGALVSTPWPGALRCLRTDDDRRHHCSTP